MNKRLLFVAAILLGFGGFATMLPAQQDAGLTDPVEARRQLAEAQRQGQAAQARAEQLEQAAQAAGAAAERSASEAAAAAARIQQAESAVTAQQARIALIDRQRDDLAAAIALRQQPLVRLTAGLQRLSRRPLLFTLFRPGSVRDTVHLSAVLQTVLPEVARRTAGLRSELDRARLLRAQAETGIAALRSEQQDLARRRSLLADMETRQRLAARQSAGTADREAERALALAEAARDLGVLADDLGKAGQLREQLARLPGPVMRPSVPGQGVAPPTPEATLPSTLAVRAPAFILPVQGRVVLGYGTEVPGQPRSRGVGIAAAPGAQAVAPAPGRVAFAGTWRSFGRIVIIDHGQRWTSLVTGLGQVAVNVGDQLVAGSPLGAAPPGRPVISLELRRDGQPVNPLDFARP